MLFVPLVKLSYWSKFHVNIITDSGIITVFFYKGLTRNPEIGNIPVWFLPNIWRLGKVMDTKFGTNIPNKILRNAAKFRITALTASELLREKTFIRIKKFELDRPLPKKIKKSMRINERLIRWTNNERYWLLGLRAKSKIIQLFKRQQ